MKQDLKPCACSPGCEAQTRRTFAPGHDARLLGYLVRQVAEGEMTPEEAQAEGLARGATPLMQKKIARAVVRAQLRRHGITKP